MPTAAEVATWLAAMAGGTRDEDVLVALVASNEYFNGHGGGSNNNFLEGAYQDLLGRPIDEDARNFWLPQLNSNSVSRAGLATALLTSSEYRNTLANTFLSRFLRRPGTETEVAGLVGQLNGGATQEAIMASVLGSSEYASQKALLVTEPLTQTKKVWLRVTNSCRSVDSSTITISVSCPLNVSQPRSATINAGAQPIVGVTAFGIGPFSYQWYEGQPGDTSHPIPGATGPNLTNVTFNLPGSHTYWVKVTNDCTSVNSLAASVTVTCGQPPKPRLGVPPTSPASVGYTIQWGDGGASSLYEVQEAKNRDFSDAVTIPPSNPNDPASTTRRIAAKNVTVDTRYFYRVRGKASCDGSFGQYSDIGSILVLAPPPLRFTNYSTGVPYDTTTPFTVRYGVAATTSATGKTALAGGTFTITTDAPWLVVTPSTGTLPDDGSVLPVNVTIDPNTLPIGSTTATMTVRVDSGSGKGALAVSVKPVPITISKVTPVSPTPKTSDPDPGTLLVPAVAHADGANNSRFVSDVRITNVSGATINYFLNFVTTQTDGTQSAKQTQISIAAGETKALNDVVHDWFGAGAAGEGGLGTLEIRPDAPSGKGLVVAPTSGGPSVKLATVASSRTYNLTENGTYGQYIPALPIASFIGKFLSNGTSPASISLQQLAQNSDYRTNFGFVEGSGKPVAMTLSLFDNKGAKIRTAGMNLAPFEHRQMRLDELFAGITVSDARLEVKVDSDAGKVTAYASLLDNKTSDPLLVLPVQPSFTTETRYVVPGVAELNNGAANFHTDMRLYNSGPSAQKISLAYSTTDRTPPAPVERTLAPGEVLSIDNTLLSLWNISGSGGAVVVTTDSPTALVVTARTFSRRDDGGTFGQFIPAVTPSDAVALGDRSLEVLQLEQSAAYRTNLGLVEVTGQPVDLEITATTPDSKASAKIPQHLDAGQFLQLNAVFNRFGFGTVYNGRISVKVVGGNGKVSAYGSVIDGFTQDPTYVPAQQ